MKIGVEETSCIENNATNHPHLHERAYFLFLPIFFNPQSIASVSKMQFTFFLLKIFVPFFPTISFLLCLSHFACKFLKRKLFFYGLGWVFPFFFSVHVKHVIVNWSNWKAIWINFFFLLLLASLVEELDMNNIVQFFLLHLKSDLKIESYFFEYSSLFSLRQQLNKHKRRKFILKKSEIEAFPEA